MYPDASFSYYDKRHLFTIAGEGDPYQAGKERVLFDVKGWKILPSICYDLRFPVWSRQTPGESFEYDLLLYVANWPKPRVNAWDTLLQARAIENLSYCVGVNRVGEDGTGAAYVGHSNAYDYIPSCIYTYNTYIYLYAPMKKTYRCTGINPYIYMCIYISL